MRINEKNGSSKHGKHNTAGKVCLVGGTVREDGCKDVGVGHVAKRGQHDGYVGRKRKRLRQPPLDETLHNTAQDGSVPKLYSPSTH